MKANRAVVIICAFVVVTIINITVVSARRFTVCGLTGLKTEIVEVVGKLTHFADRPAIRPLVWRYDNWQAPSRKATGENVKESELILVLGTHCYGAHW